MSTEKKLKQFENISQNVIKTLGVQALSDRPNASSIYGTAGKSSTELKKWFDQLAEELAKKINALHSTFSSGDIAQYIRLTFDEYDIDNLDIEHLQDFLDAVVSGKFAEKLLMVLPSQTDEERVTLQEAIFKVNKNLADGILEAEKKLEKELNDIKQRVSKITGVDVKLEDDGGEPSGKASVTEYNGGQKITFTFYNLIKGGTDLITKIPLSGGSGSNSLAQTGNTASEKNAVAFGAGTTASGVNSFAKGKSTHAEGGRSSAEGFNTFAVGTDSHAEGNNTHAEGGQSHAEGSGTKAIGDQSHAEGSGTTASKGKAHAEGLSTTASGYASHAEGNSTTAEGENSHAEGLGTYAKSNSSHAEGFETKALQGTAHAEGDATTAEGWSSHAEGYHTLANKGSAHAEGYYTKAIGDYSHSEGSNTEASGSCSHAAGLGTIASGTNQTVVGEYNEEKTNALFIVGKGTGSSKSSRSNAFEVLNDGTVKYKGQYKVATGEVAAVLSSSYQMVTIVLDFEPNLIVVHGKDSTNSLASALWSNGRVCFANEGFRGDARFANNKVAISFAYNMSGTYTYTAIGGVAGIDSSGGGTIPPSGGDTGGDSSGGSGGESGGTNLVEFSLDGETQYVEKGTLWGAWASGKEGYVITSDGRIRVGEKYIYDINKRVVTSDKAIEKGEYQTLEFLNVTIDYTNYASVETITLEEMFVRGTIITSDFILEGNRFVDKVTGRPLVNADGTEAHPTDVCAGKTYYCNNTPESSITKFYITTNILEEEEEPWFEEYTIDQKNCHNWTQWLNLSDTPSTYENLNGKVYNTEYETYLMYPGGADVGVVNTIRNGFTYYIGG